MDFINNGQAYGSVASRLLATNFDMAAMRPYVGQDGRSYITQNGVAVPTQNATATLRRDEWVQVDGAVISAARQRMRVVADLRAAGLTFTIPNGMGKTVLESETISDITPAELSMDPARESEYDRPDYGVTGVPLPVIHKDFYFTARQIAVSRNTGAGVDVTTAEMAARKVAEEAEKLTIGTGPDYKYAGYNIYGLINFPQRITVELTDPTSSAWTPQILLEELLDMRQRSVNARYYGPWVLYVSPGWALYLDNDFSTAKGDNTVRQRLMALEGISSIRTADFLEDYQMVLVQMTSDVVRLVIGMDITTVQWETLGGMRINYKVMAIMVPQLRSVSGEEETAGIVHGAVT